ncbi:hypothetical protein ASF29_05840 [Rhizobium sp. Leaf262]|nr:hypothetical protein ASF29_05840 [Rhizobium sp. Leaf262]
MLDESRLHRMQITRLTQPFNGRDIFPVMHDRQCQTGVDPFAVDKNSASATLPMITALFRSCKMKMLTQSIEQRRSIIDVEIVFLTIYGECDF